MIGQTLSLIGLLAVAAVIALIAQSVSLGAFAWGRALLALAVAALCFWAAAPINRHR